MNYRGLENNQVLICGKIHEEFAFNHKAFGEKFYSTTLDTERLSGRVDSIPIMVSDRLIDVNKCWSGKKVEIDGDIRTYGIWNDGKRHLTISVYATYLLELSDDCLDENQIYLNGYICKDTVYRETPMGREITDLLLAVNRPYGKSSYIPCICWGRNAKFADGLNVGEHIKVHGRFQSREYQKTDLNGEHHTKTAYEVSLSSMEVVADDESQEIE